MNTKRKVILVILAILLLSAAVYWIARPKLGSDGYRVNQKQSALDDSSARQSPDYAGAVLAGDQALVLDFNQQDYEKARDSDKLVVLYFYANWCPVCREEVPKMYSAFEELDTDKVVAFRVNYNDNQTDDSERALARKFGVAYQHTKVFLQNDGRLLKSPESWDKERYLLEINNTLKGLNQ